MSEEGKKHQHYHPEPTAPPQQYGTFQGAPGYPPPQPAIGFPQPVPPTGATSGAAVPSYYAHGYQAVPGIPRLLPAPFWAKIALLAEKRPSFLNLFFTDPSAVGCLFLPSF